MAGLITAMLFFESCTREEVMPIEDQTVNILQNVKSGKSIKLGKQLENPYSVENMKIAWENLINSNGRVEWDELTIETSHYYVKFKPKDDFEYSALVRDESLELYTYPLDFEIEQTGDYYHDPEVPTDVPTYQYAAVKTDYVFPNVDYEILAGLYIPEEVEVNDNGRVNVSIVEALVDEALRITGNLEKDKEGAENGRAVSSWTPMGRIRVWDYVLNNFAPVYDVKVRATRWFTTHTGVTNAKGVFICDGSFERPANYSIQWEKYQFSVRSGTFGQAVYDGPKQEGMWVLDIGLPGSDLVNNSQQYYALIFQAARDYYYGPRFGLASPPRNSTFHPQVKIAADIQPRQLEKPSHAAIYARTLGIFPSIYIRTFNKRADRVYAVTTHELAHAAHWDMDRSTFGLLVTGAYIGKLKSSEAVIESWANGVEWQFAMERYRNTFNLTGYEYYSDVWIRGFSNGNYQAQRLLGFNQFDWELTYTSIVVDMIDNDNQRNTRGHGGSAAYPQDQVAGYTISQIEQSLKGSGTWQIWRNQMISKHNNATKGFVGELFTNWY